MASPYAGHTLRAAELHPTLDLVERVHRVPRYRKCQRVDHEFEFLLRKYNIDYSAYGFVLGSTDISFKAINKYAIVPDNYDDALFAKATLMLRESYSVISGSRFTYDFLDWMDGSTSPGYPWSLKYQKKRKFLEDSVLRAELIRRVAIGVLDDAYWSVVVKTEPKKMEKIKDNDARIILSAPIETQAEGNYLFCDQNEKIYDAARDFKIPSTVGFTHFYQGWNDLYKRMIRSNYLPLGLALDYRNYDGSCQPREFYVVKTIRFSAFNAELQTLDLWERICRYYDQVVHTKIVMETGDVVRKHIGNPSGQGNTITDNSMINELRWYYMWVSSTPPSCHTLKSFREHCELVVCGDDSLISCDCFARSCMTPVHLKRIGEIMGWHFKFELSDYQPIHKLTYLSKHFMWVSGFVVPAPSNVEKLLASILYGSKGKLQHYREVVSRLLGIRLESYWLVRFRSLLEEYIEKIFKEHFSELRSQPTQDMPSYSDLLSMRRDHFSVMTLYLGNCYSVDRSFRPLTGNIPEFPNSHVRDLDFLVREGVL